VDNALKHEYFKSLYKESQILECKNQIQIDWEKTELDEARIQSLMWEEIYHFRPSLKEEREKRLKDGSIPDFKTYKAQQQKFSSTSKGPTQQLAPGTDVRARSSSKGDKSSISEPIADDSDADPSKK